jgi:hypothetical protein
MTNRWRRAWLIQRLLSQGPRHEKEEDDAQHRHEAN